jgi:flagellar biosynthesis protein FlhA
LQDNTLLPLVLILSRFCCQDSFVIGFIVIPFTLSVTFILIKKGVERISEVSARFALDTMTTRMTNIDNKYAKLISGNAKAILFMTSIDIAGGIVIGYFMQGKTLFEAIEPAILFTTGTVVLYCVPLIIISIASVFCVTNKVRMYYFCFGLVYKKPET